MLSERCLEASGQSARLSSLKSVSDGPERRCNIFTLCEETRGREEIGEIRKNAPTCRSSGRTFDNELYFARRRARSTWESQSVPEIDREATRTHSRVLQQGLPSTFVVLAAFIDGKSVADLRSRISVEKPEERCHFGRRESTLHATQKNLPKTKIRSIDFAKMSRSVSRCCREASSHTSK